MLGPNASIITPRTSSTTDTIEDGEVVFFPGIAEPMINKVMTMDKEMIFSQLSASTAFDVHAFAPWSLYDGSNGFNPPFDFSTKDFFLDRENYLFIAATI